jgi:hypothetical protein
VFSKGACDVHGKNIKPQYTAHKEVVIHVT